MILFLPHERREIMTLYTLSLKRQNDEFHEIHQETCKYRPINRFYEVSIGTFYDDKEAILVSKKLYYDAEPCPFCMLTDHAVESA